jgi:polyhydroxybutyrate depolymerase
MRGRGVAGILAGAGLLALALAETAGVAQASTIVDYSLLRPEGRRRYIVVEPDRLARSSRPTVILLHGHGASAAFMVGLDSFATYKAQDWIRLAERERVMLIAPDGIKGSDGKQAWNDCRADAGSNASSDDVGFLAALIDTAVNELGADPERIYVYGSANGGGMAYRLGIELGPRLAAIGVQSALMPMQSRCKPPTHPIPVFVTHGTADPIAPYNGGKVGHWLLRDRGSGVSADESVAVWRRLAGLPESPMSFRLPHLQSSDPTSATRYVWGSDPAKVQVEFMRIDGGGHTASSKVEELPWILRKLVGNMNHDVDTAEEAWNFFKDKRAAGAR